MKIGRFAPVIIGKKKGISSFLLEETQPNPTPKCPHCLKPDVLTLVYMSGNSKGEQDETYNCNNCEVLSYFLTPQMPASPPRHNLTVNPGDKFIVKSSPVYSPLNKNDIITVVKDEGQAAYGGTSFQCNVETPEGETRSVSILGTEIRTWIQANKLERHTGYNAPKKVESDDWIKDCTTSDTPEWLIDKLRKLRK